MRPLADVGSYWALAWRLIEVEYFLGNYDMSTKRIPTWVLLYLSSTRLVP